MYEVACPCGLAKSFGECCGQFISGEKLPENAEQLMRSRYSAYATGKYQYILDTYGKTQRAALTTEQLAQSAQGQTWCKLTIESSTLLESPQTVEFRAFYKDNDEFYCLHEISSFELENEQWRYVSGEVKADSGLFKLGRNDLCLCGSNKKFKKCCGK